MYNIEEIDEGVFDSDGNGTISIYEVKDNELISYTTIECVMTDKSEEIIIDHLIDVGEDTNVTLINL